MILYYVSLGDMNRNKIARASGAVCSLIGLAAIRDGVAPAKAAAISKLALMVLANLAGCTDGRAVLMDFGAIAVVAGLIRDGVVGSGSAEEEYCLFMLFGLSRGSLRFRGLARAAGVEAVLVRVAEGDGEGTMRREMAKRTLRAMRGEDDEASSYVHQLLELSNRYVVEILSGAQVYADHAGKPPNAIDTKDVRLATQSKVNSSFTQPPPQELQVCC